MKKTTRIFSILLIAAMLLGALALTTSASKPIETGPFTVQATEQIATDTETGQSKNFGTDYSTFESLSYTVVDSQTIQFSYAIWLRTVGGGNVKHYNTGFTLTGYSCDVDINVTFDRTFKSGSDNWTYKIVVTKSAGHVYDNACDTECNICKATRTITHDHQGGNCTTDAVCTVCGDVKAAPGHIYAAGACTTCGEACPHTDNSPVIVDNRNGTHTEKYNCCGLVVSTTDHQLDAKGFCTTAGCGGYQAAVLNNGTYEISNAGQLYWFAQHVNSGNQYANGRLTANITVNTNVLTATGDLNGDPASFRAWTPIDQFRGSFHGDGYVISGLYAKDYGVGFISYGSNVKVYNLGVMDSYFENTGYASGAIVGYMASNGTMENCFSNATIAGSSYISGGLVGNANHYATVKNCYYFGKTVGGAFAYSGFSWYGSKSGNNYYVSTVDDGCEFTTAISADILASGELAYLLNGSVNGGAAWGQVIGTDAYPIPVAGENEKVYRVTLCNGAQGYANSEKITEHDPSVTAADRFNAAGQCLVCGTQGVAMVNDEFYVSIDTALAKAESTNGATVKLLADIDMGTATLRINSGVFTLDLNGKILSNNEDRGLAFITINGSTQLTIIDTATGGKIFSTGLSTIRVRENSVLTFNSGTVECTDMDAIWYQSSQSSTFNGGTIIGGDSAICSTTEGGLIINGGTLRGKYYAIDSDEASVTINGGTLTGGVYISEDANWVITGGTFTGEADDNDIGVSLYADITVTVTGGSFPGGFKVGGTTLAKVMGKDYFTYNADGTFAVISDTDTILSGDIVIKKGADLSYATITVNGTYAYIGKEVKPTDITVVINGQTVDPAHYTITYSNNINIGTATVTVTGQDPYSGTNSTTFEITKGNLKVVTNPETTYEFGAAVGDVVSGGKVVIEGNESAVITGTWAWVEHSQTAQFTPDAQYVDLFEALTEAVTVTHVVTPATPVIEVVSPSPSIMPGMAIRMSVVVKNPHNGELTDLPTAFRVTYKIGETGTPVTVDGLEFTLPTTGVALGDKVYVTVENVAVDGKYAVAVSTNTIELAVGQVDFTSAINALEEQIAALQAEHNADVSALEAELAALKAAVAALDDTYATDEELAAAVQTINDTITALTNRITTLETTYATKAELEKAIADLNKAIAEGDAANAEALAKAVETLEKALADAVAALEKADADNKAALEALIAEAKTALETAITALEERVDQNETDIAALQAALAQAIADLNKAIAEGDAANAEALAKAVETLEKALADAVAALEKADADNKAALEVLIAEAKTALEAAIAQLRQDLEDAVADLENADKENAEALAQAIKELTAAIESVEAASAAADAQIRAELTAAKAVLQSAINSLSAQLSATKNQLLAAIAAGDSALEEKIADLAAALEAAVAASQAADEALKAELNARIDEAVADLEAAIAAVAENLEKAQQELQDAIAAGDKKLHIRVESLGESMGAALAAAQVADEVLKTELNARIDEAVAALEAAIAQVQKNLDEVKAELMAKDEQLAAKDAQLNTMVIVAIVLGGMGVCGCTALLIFIIADKRKKAI